MICEVCGEDCMVLTKKTCDKCHRKAVGNLIRPSVEVERRKLAPLEPS